MDGAVDQEQFIEELLEEINFTGDDKALKCLKIFSATRMYPDISNADSRRRDSTKNVKTGASFLFMNAMYYKKQISTATTL